MTKRDKTPRYPISRDNKIPQKWYITQDLAMRSIKVICPRCQALVLEYRDGVKLKAREVEHCGERDTFYISEEL